MKGRGHISTGNGIATGNINCDSSKPKKSSYPFILKGYFLSYSTTCQHPHQKDLNNKTSLERREAKTKPIKQQSDAPKHPSTFRQASISCIDYPRTPNETINVI